MGSSSSTWQGLRTTRSVLEMDGDDSRRFFLKPDSYCRMGLPPYYTFEAPLQQVAQRLAAMSEPLNGVPAGRCEDVNHTIYTSKDGIHSWRPLQLIHPVLYVDLVNVITAESAWPTLQACFRKFSEDKRILCQSIPQEALRSMPDQSAQIVHWWHEVEQLSIEFALDYEFMLHADIADCYASMYTHAVAWAIHGRPEAKRRRRDANLLGNKIDKCIQHMHNGQTNGIPQGSVLFDFIAELVLGYADHCLAQRLMGQTTERFQILRYRDDYRIFVDSRENGARILRALSEVLQYDVGLRLNTAKTTDAERVIGGAIKPDKMEWMTTRQSDANLQKHLLIIHRHACNFPHAGSLHRALDDFNIHLCESSGVSNPIALIAIAIDIGYHNPRVFPICAAIVSRLLQELHTTEDRINAIERIHRRLASIPKKGMHEIWLQRITYPIKKEIEYDETLCRLLYGGDTEVRIWNSSWLKDKDLRAAIDGSLLIDQGVLATLRPVVPTQEIEMFRRY